MKLLVLFSLALWVVLVGAYGTTKAPDAHYALRKWRSASKPYLPTCPSLPTAFVTAPTSALLSTALSTTKDLLPSVRRLARLRDAFVNIPGVSSRTSGSPHSLLRLGSGLDAASRQLLTLRDDLRDREMSTPHDLAPASKDFIRSFPRYNFKQEKTRNRVPSLDLIDKNSPEYNQQNPGKSDGEEFTEGAIEYGQGAVLVTAIPIILAVLMLLAFLLYCCISCCSLCCCKSERKFSPKSRMIAKVSMVVVLAIFFTVGMLAYSGSVGLSEALDEGFTTANTTVDFFYNIAVVANSSRLIGRRAVDIAKELNHTIMSVVPSVGRLLEYRNCLNTTLDILDIKDDMLALLRRLNDIVAGLVDFGLLNSTVASLNSAVKALPDLHAIHLELVNMNTTLANLPNAVSLSNDLSALNSSLNALKDLSRIAEQLTQLENAIQGVQLNALASDLQAYDSAVDTLPDLNQLHADAGITGAGADATVQARLASSLVQFNNSVNAMPDALGMKNNMLSFNTSVGTVANIVSTFTITSIVSAINGLPTTTSLLGHLSSISSFQTSAANILDALRVGLIQIDLALTLLPPVPSLLGQVIAVNASVNSIKAINLTDAIQLLYRVNASIPPMRCVLIVFDDIRKVNETIVELPSAVDVVFEVEEQIRKVLDDPSQYTGYIDDGEKALRDVQKGIDDLPNFNSLANQVSDFNASFLDIPDISKTLADLNTMNASLNDVPDLAPYTSQVSELNSTINLPDLSSTERTIADLNNSIADVPDLGPYLNNVDALNSTLFGLSDRITLAHQAVVNPAYIGNGIPAPIRTSLQSSIVELNTTLSTRPNVTQLIDQLKRVNSSINTRPNITDLVEKIKNLNSTVQQFPDVSTLSAGVDSLKSIRSNTATLDDLIKTGELLTLNQSVIDLPNLDDTQKQVLDMDKTIKDLDLNKTINDLNLGDDLDRNKILDEFNNVLEQREKFNETDKYLRDAEEYLEDARKEWDRVLERRQDIWDELGKVQKDANDIDGLRLLVMVLIIFFPLLIVFLANIFGWCCNIGYPSLCMAFMFFPLAALYFIIAALQMPLAVVLSDHCPVIETMVHEGLGDAVLNISGVNVSEILDIDEKDTTEPLSDLFDYFTQCKGRLAIYDAIGPNEVSSYLNRKEYNVSIQLDKLENPTDGGDRYVLRPPIKNLMFKAERLVPLFDQIVYDFRNAIDCPQTKKIYDGLRRTLCFHVAGSWALSASMFFMLATCMIPSICVGVRASRRFPKPVQVEDEEVAEDDLYDEELYDEDPNDGPGGREAWAGDGGFPSSDIPPVVQGTPVVDGGNIELYGNNTANAPPQSPLSHSQLPLTSGQPVHPL